MGLTPLHHIPGRLVFCSGTYAVMLAGHLRWLLVKLW